MLLHVVVCKNKTINQDAKYFKTAFKKKVQIFK